MSARPHTLIFAACVVLIPGCSDESTPSAADSSGPPDAAPATDRAGSEQRSEAGLSDMDPCLSTVTPKPGTVITDKGAVTGLAQGASWVFKGIPYAAPPLGELRFKPPAEHACWTGERATKAFGQVCPQLGGTGQFVGDEDCLTLNIWTPTAAPGASAGLPVMFFIHGGGHVQGASSTQAQDGTYLYDGQALSERSNVVVVTINYRLNALGNLAHPALADEGDPQASGNYGLLDQLAALQWVQRNIAVFGGDPQRVLLFGESAGGVDTCLLLTSPLAKGLFHAALMQSGLCAAQTKADAEAFGLKFAEEAQCSTAADIPACLRGLTAEALVRTLPGVVDLTGKKSQYQPHLDGWVLPGPPLEMLAAGTHNQVPFIVGANADETGAVVPVMNEDEYKAAVYALAGNVQLGNAVLAQYPVSDYGTGRQAFIALTSDAVFICNARRALRAAAQGQSLPVYRYHFSHTLENGGAVLTAMGAFHGLEIAFIFLHLQTGGYAPSPGEETLAGSMADYWSTFAASGQPDVPSAALSWPEYDPALDNYLELDVPLAIKQGVRTIQCDFWDSVLP